MDNPSASTSDSNFAAHASTSNEGSSEHAHRAIEAVIVLHPELAEKRSQLRSSSIEGFDEFIYVSLVDEAQRPLRGGSAYLVLGDGQVFVCPSSQSPRQNCEQLRQHLSRH